MEILIVLLGFIILVGAGFGLRFLIRETRSAALLRAENHKLHVETVAAATESRMLRQMRYDTMDMAEKAGTGLGIMAAIEKFAQLSGQQAQAQMAIEQKSLYANQVQILQENSEKLASENSGLAKTVDGLRERYNDKERELRRLKATYESQGLDEWFNPNPAANSPQSAAKVPPKSRQVPQKPFQSPAEALPIPHSAAAKQQISGDGYPVFGLRNNHSYYKAKGTDDFSKIIIYDKQDNEVDWINPASLGKGQPRKILEGAYLVKCALPNCENIKLTKNSNTKTCCDEHRREYQKFLYHSRK